MSTPTSTATGYAIPPKVAMTVTTQYSVPAKKIDPARKPSQTTRSPEGCRLGWFGPPASTVVR